MSFGGSCGVFFLGFENGFLFLFLEFSRLRYPNPAAEAARVTNLHRLIHFEIKYLQTMV